MKTKYEYLTRIINPAKEIVSETEHSTLEFATHDAIHTTQVTFEDAEENRVRYGHGYTHVMEFRDDEHYNDLYFI